jgi:hypothetical protein
MKSPPKVVVSCPAEKCLYNVIFNSVGYCAAKPWIDMTFNKNNVECLDYVDKTELP